MIGTEGLLSGSAEWASSQSQQRGPPIRLGLSSTQARHKASSQARHRGSPPRPVSHARHSLSSALTDGQADLRNVCIICHRIDQTNRNSYNVLISHIVICINCTLNVNEFANGPNTDYYEDNEHRMCAVGTDVSGETI